jgi:hypothetical protein
VVIYVRDGYMRMGLLFKYAVSTALTRTKPHLPSDYERSSLYFGFRP